MNTSSSSPYYVKLGYRFLVIFFICYFIYISRGVLIPFAFAILLAVLLLPIANFFERNHCSRSLSIGISLILTAGIVSVLIYFFSTQIANFVDDIPSIKSHLQVHLEALQAWIKKTFHVSFHDQNAYINNAAEKLKDNGTGYLSNTFFSITETIFIMILLPIYTFLILYYRDLIRKFLYAVFQQQHKEKISNVIKESKTMIHNYMVGLVIEMSIVALCNSFGLILLGIKYAVFFGVLAAVLNIIPYIGMFTATLFTVIITLTTSSNTSDIIWIIVIMYGIHIIDVNILMPKIVASKLRINALISILGVMIGGALTGLSGLFLSVPAIAMLKIICDQVPDLAPWGMLMGDEISGTKTNRIIKKIKDLKLIKKQKMPLKDN